MHAIAYVGLSPDGEWMACQSLDNQVVMYATGDKFRVHRKKRFRGHMNAGYACMCGFSPDGKYVLSGDGDGKYIRARRVSWSCSCGLLLWITPLHVTFSLYKKGRIFIWDWKTSRICKTIRCHRGVCIGALWHPVEPSKVATCGWDGLINLWDWYSVCHSFHLVRRARREISKPLFWAITVMHWCAVLVCWYVFNVVAACCHVAFISHNEHNHRLKFKQSQKLQIVLCCSCFFTKVLKI